MVFLCSWRPSLLGRPSLVGWRLFPVPNIRLCSCAQVLQSGWMRPHTKPRAAPQPGKIHGYAQPNRLFNNGGGHLRWFGQNSCQKPGMRFVWSESYTYYCLNCGLYLLFVVCFQTYAERLKDCQRNMLSSRKNIHIQTASSLRTFATLTASNHQ